MQLKNDFSQKIVLAIENFIYNYTPYNPLADIYLEEREKWLQKTRNFQSKSLEKR